LLEQSNAKLRVKFKPTNPSNRVSIRSLNSEVFIFLNQGIFPIYAVRAAHRWQNKLWLQWVKPK